MQIIYKVFENMMPKGIGISHHYYQDHYYYYHILCTYEKEYDLSHGSILITVLPLNLWFRVLKG